MSVSALIYLGVVAFLWAPCALAVRRVSEAGVLDRAAAGLVTAFAWPITVPLLSVAAARGAVARMRRPGLAVAEDGLEALALDAPVQFPVAVNS
jgi:hypothetical protein